MNLSGPPSQEKGRTSQYADLGPEPNLSVLQTKSQIVIKAPKCLPNVVFHAEESQLGVVLGEGVDGVASSEVVFLGNLGASDETVKGWVVLKVTCKQNPAVREKTKLQSSYQALGVRSV